MLSLHFRLVGDSNLIMLLTNIKGETETNHNV